MLGNLILETTNAPGNAADCLLLGPAAGRLPFSFWFASGAQCFYVLNDGTQQEWGIGTFTAGSPNKLTRTTVIKNSAGSTARLNFLGSTRVYNDIPAERSLWVDNGGNVNFPSAIVATGLSLFNSGGPAMSMSDTDAPLDQKIFDFTSNSGQLWGRAVNDAYNAANNWLSVTRSGYVVGTITLAGTAINLNGTVNTGVLNAGSVMTCHNSLSITADTGQGATLWLNMASGQPSQIVSSRPAPAGTRWNVQLGNGQDNDNFYIHRYDDTGGYLDAPLTINRATAAVTMLGVVTAGAFSTSGTVTANSGATVGGLHSTAGVAADGAVTAGSSVTAGGTVYIANTVAANAYQLWGIAGYQTISFTTDGWLLQHENSSGNLSYFPPAGGAIFWTAGIDFHVRGNVVAANVSDERAKRHVEAYTRGLADLIRLRPIIYSYNGRGGTIDDGARRIGLNARESQPFIPECVIPTPEPPPGAMRQDGTRATVPDDRLPNQLSLDDRPLLYALLNGMRELAEQNTALVARITALEAKGTTA